MVPIDPGGIRRELNAPRLSANALARASRAHCRSFLTALVARTVLNLTNQATRRSAQCLSIGSRSC